MLGTTPAGCWGSLRPGTTFCKLCLRGLPALLREQRRCLRSPKSSQGSPEEAESSAPGQGGTAGTRPPGMGCPHSVLHPRPLLGLFSRAPTRRPRRSLSALRRRTRTRSGGGAPGDPDFQETGNREKFAKRSKALAEQQRERGRPARRSAGPSPGSPSSPGTELRSPRRQRAPLPAAAPGTELRLPAAPSASFGAPSPGHAAPPPRSGPGSPELRPPPRGSAPLSRHGSGPGSPARAEPGPGASRGTEPRFPRGPHARTLPRAPRSGPAAGAEPRFPREPPGPVPPTAPGSGARRARPRSRQTSSGAAGAGPVAAAALTSRQGGQQEHQEAGRQEPLHPALLPPLTAA